MPPHERAGLSRVTGANGAVDLAVHVSGNFQVPRSFGGLAALIVERRGDGLHKRRQDGIAGRLSDDAVKTNIVN